MTLFLVAFLLAAHTLAARNISDPDFRALETLLRTDWCESRDEKKKKKKKKEKKRLVC